MPTGMSPWKTDLVRVALCLLALFTTEQNKPVHLWRKGQKTALDTEPWVISGKQIHT